MSPQITTVGRLHRAVAVMIVASMAFVAAPVATASAGTDLAKLAERIFHADHLDTRSNPTASGVNDYPATSEIDGFTDLLQVARDWSTQMAANDRLAHNPNLGDAACCWRRIGENVAVFRGNVSTEEKVRAATERLMTAWIDSDGHRRNLMDGQWGQFAVGVTITDDALWATAVFRTLDGKSTPPGHAYGVEGPDGEGSRDVNSTDHVQPVARDTSDLCDGVEHDGYADSNGRAHDESIRCASAHGLANGRNDTTYDPGGSVTRAQVMAFMRRAVENSGFTLDENAPDYFSDDNGTAHEQSANMLAHAGLVNVGNGKLRPNAFASRAFIASVAGRALNTVKGITTDLDYFSDDDGHASEGWINILGEAGVVTGSADGSYGPDAGLSRAQIATVLVRTFDALTA